MGYSYFVECVTPQLLLLLVHLNAERNRGESSKSGTCNPLSQLVTAQWFTFQPFRFCLQKREGETRGLDYLCSKFSFTSCAAWDTCSVFSSSSCQKDNQSGSRELASCCPAVHQSGSVLHSLVNFQHTHTQT